MNAGWGGYITASSIVLTTPNLQSIGEAEQSLSGVLDALDIIGVDVLEQELLTQDSILDFFDQCTLEEVVRSLRWRTTWH